MDFHEQLRKQLSFLETSCVQYDAGNRDEGVRIAVSLRVLFHDTSSSTSLLKHLNAKQIQLLSTAEDIPQGVRFWSNLTNLILAPPNAYAAFSPKLDAAHTKRFIALQKWWDNELVYLIESGNITRRDVVLAAANNDGGAHVDAALNTEYKALLNGAGWKMTVNPDNGPSRDIVFQDAHLSALRQMGFEVLNSPDIYALSASPSS